MSFQQDELLFKYITLRNSS